MLWAQAIGARWNGWREFEWRRRAVAAEQGSKRGENDRQQRRDSIGLCWSEEGSNAGLETCGIEELSLGGSVWLRQREAEHGGGREEGESDARAMK